MEENEQMVDSNTLQDEKVNQDTSTPDTQSTDDSSLSDKQEQEKVSPDVQKLKELANNYKIRAEKAEKMLKENKQTTSTPNLSVKDLTALVKANVNEDDYDDIFDYAKLKKISVAEALRTPIIQTLLSEKEESRKTAQATATGSNISRPTPEDASILLARAKRTGEIPDSDEALRKMVEARLRKL